MIKELNPNGASAAPTPSDKHESSTPISPRENKPSTKPAAKQTFRKKKEKRSRKTRLYPSLPLEDALKLGEAIHEHASGDRVNRLTLFKAINKSPTSSTGQILITASAKYKITLGSFVSDYLELTADGKIATDATANPVEKAKARFELGIQSVESFKALYSKYKGKRLPSMDVMTDALKEAKLEIDDPKECIELFMVNCKFVGLLQTIAGAETLLPVEAVLEEISKSSGTPLFSVTAQVITGGAPIPAKKLDTKINWENICFYITPIGDEGSECRKHSDLFLGSLIEPALKELKLDVIRADKIAEPGMITSQVLEHIVNSRLVIVDLSYQNPNVFYEMAIRHACKLPVVQICRKADRIPFDVNQVRTVAIDTTDIFTLIPKLDVYRAEIATQARMALEGQQSSNPISIFLPQHGIVLKKETVKI